MGGHGRDRARHFCIAADATSVIIERVIAIIVITIIVVTTITKINRPEDHLYGHRCCYK